MNAIIKLLLWPYSANSPLPPEPQTWWKRQWYLTCYNSRLRPLTDAKLTLASTLVLPLLLLGLWIFIFVYAWPIASHVLEALRFPPNTDATQDLATLLWFAFLGEFVLLLSMGVLTSFSLCFSLALFRYLCVKFNLHQSSHETKTL